jgi:mono/diheme cytochrome c family protein
MRKFIWGLMIGSAAIPLVAALVFLLGWSPVDATSNPPLWENVLARRSLAASVARQAPRLSNPVAATSDNFRAGMKIYRDACAGCHGDSGKPSHWGTTGFYPRVPQFDSEPPQRPDWELFWIVKHGVRYSGMAAWEGELPEHDMWMVVTFLSHLRTLPADVQAQWRQQNPKQP